MCENSPTVKWDGTSSPGRQQIQNTHSHYANWKNLFKWCFPQKKIIYVKVLWGLQHCLAGIKIFKGRSKIFKSFRQHSLKFSCYFFMTFGKSQAVFNSTKEKYNASFYSIFVVVWKLLPTKLPNLSRLLLLLSCTASFILINLHFNVDAWAWVIYLEDLCGFTRCCS